MSLIYKATLIYHLFSVIIYFPLSLFALQIVNILIETHFLEGFYENHSYRHNILFIGLSFSWRRTYCEIWVFHGGDYEEYGLLGCGTV
jgi:hypothetical protein